MAIFNPYAPCVMGVEWFPPFEEGIKIGSHRNGPVAVMTSDATATDPDVWVLFSGKTGSPVVAVDIYPLGGPYDEADTAVGTHRPTMDVRNINGWAWGSFSPGGTQTNIYRGIDSASLIPGTWPNTGQPVTNNEFIYPIFGSGYEVTFRFGGINGVYTGDRVCTVTLNARINIFVDIELVKGMRVTPYLNIDGQRFFGSSRSVSDTVKNGHLLTAAWDYNPATGGPWLVADVEEFDDAGGASSAGWIVDATGSSNNLATILQGWMEITTSTPDNRVGAGFFRKEIGSSDPADPRRGWNKLYMTIPWDKVDGNEYVLHFYRSSGTGSVALRRLTARDGEPGDHNEHSVARAVNFSRTDQLASIETGFSPGSAYALTVTNNGGTPTSDSQPYVSVNGDINLDCGSTANWTQELTDFKQLMTPSATDDYGFLRLFVKTTDGSPAEALTIGVYRESDDTLMSSTELVEVTDLVEPTHGRHGWQVVEVEFATPASLVSGTQYYVGITDGGYGGWAIQVLSCGLIDKTEPCGPPAGAEDTKWGGATDPLRVNGTDEDALTACMTLHINGPALDTLVATVEIDAFGVDDCVQHAHIEWTVPEEGSCEFEYIEIQRSDDLGVTWDVIAKVYTFAVVEFDDYESRRNTVVQYRGRVRLTGGGIGVMSSVEAVTVPLPCSGLVFASNLLPDLASFYVDVGGERGYLLQENFQVMQFENRNYSVKISEMAYRGDVFDVVLVVGVTEGEVPGMGVVTATTPGRSQFDRLLDAVRPSRGATVPYVAVMNENGDRWFATLDTPAGQVTVNRFHKARVRVLEVTDNPYPVAIAVDG